MYDYFIVDKDINTIQSIKKLMEDFDQYNCIGTSSCYDDAMNLILKESPNLIFLNVDSNENSFQFVNDINVYGESLIDFIALSNNKSDAYNAIKLGFIDFLLKPLTELELRKTILNFQKKKCTKKRDVICLKSYKDYQYLNIDNILFLKADNNTTEFHMNDGRVVNGYKTLKTYEKLLPDDFLRIHKSYIINQHFVSRIQFGKSTLSIKKNKHSIPFTNTYLDSVESMNNCLSKHSYAAFLN